jgi:hypothetical protein
MVWAPFEEILHEVPLCLLSSSALACLEGIVEERDHGRKRLRREAWVPSDHLGQNDIDEHVLLFLCCVVERIMA